jgi:hypothetical protein
MMTLSFQQDPQAAITEPAAFASQSFQRLSQGVISASLLLILECRPIEIGQPACRSRANRMRFLIA